MSIAQPKNRRSILRMHAIPMQRVNTCTCNRTEIEKQIIYAYLKSGNEGKGQLMQCKFLQQCIINLLSFVIKVDDLWFLITFLQLSHSFIVCPTPRRIEELMNYFSVSLTFHFTRDQSCTSSSKNCMICKTVAHFEAYAEFIFPFFEFWVIELESNLVFRISISTDRES